MPIKRYSSLFVCLVFSFGVNVRAHEESKIELSIPLKDGPFEANTESLKQYETPEWFRDAKFGIWSHWGPQAVPRAGDWYARHMYVPGSRQYDHHIKHYGHPTKTGYKDIIPLWKAEKFDPEKLMELYAKAGAKYFVSMGVHHDNFDLWNSKFQEWNAVNMGPKRDIVGAWQSAAKKHNLYFGVSEHLGASYAWFNPAHGYDEFWPLNGAGYDGEDPAYHSLYHTGLDRPYRNSSSWYTERPESQQDWFNRISDLLDQYQPDFLYTDGGIPFGKVGKTLLANFYNSNIAQHKGELKAVYTHKDIGSGEFIAEAGVQDVERGVISGINPRPWQTDTSMGDWYYSEGFNYKPTSQIVHMLTDVVSKNGNLLLNVVQYPEGDLPPESLDFLREMAAWISVNGEAIYGTRPWKIFGEGPTKAKSGHFSEEDNYTAQDVRFTKKGDVLYVVTLRPPKKLLRVKALGLNSELLEKSIKSVSLLGSEVELKWQQKADSLEIIIPRKLPSAYSSSFKIEF